MHPLLHFIGKFSPLSGVQASNNFSQFVIHPVRVASHVGHWLSTL